jgi:hypothetical protein
MAPGRYTFSPFRPTVTFRVPDGWEAGHEIAEFFDIWYGEDTTLGFANPDFVTGDHGRVDVADLSPDEVLETLSGNPDVTSYRLLGPEAIGDERGPAIAFRTREGGELFGGPDGEFHTVPRSVRGLIAALDVRGEIVLVMQMSLHPPHAVHRRTIQTVAETVRFTP